MLLSSPNKNEQQQQKKQAGAELGQAQHSWGWAWLIEARASVVVCFIVNREAFKKKN